MTENDEEFVEDNENYVDVCVGVSAWETPSGLYILEEDFKVKGEVWRVHKNDADPYPSNPHAHCIAGTPRFVGCTLHLGTRELFKKRDSLGRFLEKKQFEQLIKLISPKFPNIQLPLKI